MICKRCRNYLERCLKCFDTYCSYCVKTEQSYHQCAVKLMLEA